MKTFLKHFSKALAIGYVVFAGPSLLAADLNVGRSLFYERPLRVPSSFTTKEKAPERGAGSFWGLPEDAIVLILILLAIVAISAVMHLVNMARGGLWLARLVERQNRFRRDYEDGVAKRPLGADVCWLCGKQANAAWHDPVCGRDVSICQDCRRAMEILLGWGYAVAGLGAVALFAVSSYELLIYESFWLVDWCGDSLLTSYPCLVSGALAAVTVGVGVMASRGIVRKLVHGRIVCRDDLEHELSVREIDIWRKRVGER